MHEISSWNKMPTISWIHSFHNHPLVQEAFIKRIQQHDLASYDHILFSFHGLPERNILKQNRQCLKNDCCANNTHCYRAQCLNTCTTLANKLNLAPDRWSMSFQSRLGVNKWLSPYTNKTVKELARKGVKKLLVVCPAFVADCLETVYEIGVELKKEFVKDGGCAIDLVEGLNASSSWIFALQSMIMETVCSNTRYRA
jgi:ferrochelatase